MKLLMGLKNLAFVFVSFQLIFSPVAMGASAQKSNVDWVKSFLKVSGLTNKKMTVRDYYKKMYPYLTSDVIKKYQFFAMLDQDQLMPTVDSVTFMDANKVEQVRLNVTWDKKTYSLQTEGFGPEFKMKFNGLTLTDADFKNPLELYNKLAKETGVTGQKARTFRDIPLKVSKKEWESWSPLKKAQFFTLTRYLVDDIDNVLSSTDSKSVMIEKESPFDRFAAVFAMLLPEACATTPKKGEDCLAGAWITTYGHNISCGGKVDPKDLENQIQTNWKVVKKIFQHSEDCSRGTLPCNPTTYGFDTSSYQSGGKVKPFCVSNKAETVRYMTKECNSQSKLRKDNIEDEKADVKRILESHLLAMTGKKDDLNIVNENGKKEIHYGDKASYDASFSYVDQHLKGLSGLFSKAMEMCDKEKSDPSESYKIKSPSPLTKYNKGDQGDACDQLSTRYFALTGYINGPNGVPAEPQPPVVPPAQPQVVEQTIELAQGCQPPPPPPVTVVTAPAEPPQACIVPQPIPAINKPVVQLNKVPTKTPAVVPEEVPAKESSDGFCSKDGKFTCTGWLVGGGLLLAGIWAVKAAKKKSVNVDLPNYTPNPSPSSNAVPVPGPSNPTPQIPLPPTVSTKPTEGGSGIAPPPAASGSTRKPTVNSKPGSR